MTNSKSIIAGLFFVLLLSAPLVASAIGSIRGTVTGADAPVVGASVQLVELGRTAHTGSGGEFLFSGVPPGTYHVFVRMLGYASATRAVTLGDTDVSLTFTLVESALPGEEIVVSAVPYARSTNDQYQSVATIPMEELHEASGASFAEEIADLPGVSVRWNGSAPSRPVLRGLTDNDMLVAENGLRTGDISTFDPAHAVPIEPEAVERVDVIRGPASVMFGPNAVGGVVNVITDLIPSASSTAITGRASLMGNSVSDLYSGYLTTTWSDGSSAFKIAAGGLHSQDISIPSGFYSDPATDPVQGYNLSKIPQSFDRTSEEAIGYSYQGQFGTIGIGAKHYAMNWGIPGDPLDTFYVDGVGAVNPLFSRIQMEKYSVELRGQFDVNGSFLKQIKLNANAVDYEHSEHPTGPDMDSAGNPTGSFSEFQQNHFHQNNYNATLQFIEQPMGNWQGTIGLWTNFDNLTIDGLQPLGPNSLTTGIAGYLYEEYLASENTRFEGAVRYDYNKIATFASPGSTLPEFVNFNESRTANALTGSIGVVQKLSPELTGSFSVGRSFRAPTMQELFAYGADDATGAFMLGDSSLVPETGFGIDASLKGNFSRFSFEISPFLNLISNYLYSYAPGGIDTTQQPNYPYRQFAQTDARLYGLEASASAQIVEHLALTASASYVNSSSVKDSVTPLPFTPPMKGLLRLNYLDNKYSGVIEWRLSAAQDRLGVGENPTAGYGVLNIGAGIRLPMGSAVHHISIHCDNVLNQAYRDHLSVLKDFLSQPARGFRLVYDVIF